MTPQKVHSKGLWQLLMLKQLVKLINFAIPLSLQSISQRVDRVDPPTLQIELGRTYPAIYRTVTHASASIVTDLFNSIDQKDIFCLAKQACSVNQTESSFCCD